MKDAHAVTRQILSILGTTRRPSWRCKSPDMTVPWAARHGNKLRLGHLAGNRFAIKIRDVNPTDVVKLGRVLDDLERRGMPNFFGEQRFGRRGNNDLLGAALIRGDNEGVLDCCSGRPTRRWTTRSTIQRRARRSTSGDNAEAMKLWPRSSGMERRVLARLMKTAAGPSAAVHAIDEKLRRLWVSAVQSRLFNDVLAQRIDTFDQLLDGDLAYKHDNGACFLVESAAAEQPRCRRVRDQPDRPAGRLPHDPAHRANRLTIEQAVMAEVKLTPARLQAVRPRCGEGRPPAAARQARGRRTRRRRRRVRPAHHRRVHPPRRRIRDRADAQS